MDLVASSEHPAALALRRHLLAPDGSALVSDAGRPADPRGLALVLATGLCGGALFVGVLGGAWWTPGGTAGGIVPALLAALGASSLLTLPPLYLAHALGAREETASSEAPLHRVVAAASVGPAVCGLWLGACSPLLLLYALTGSVGIGFGVLAVGLLLASVLAGALALVRRAVPGAPGRLPLLLHYGLALWTAAILFLHLL